MEQTTEPAAVLENRPFLVSCFGFFCNLHDRCAATYTLGRLLKHDRHSDVFSLEHYPPGTKDPTLRSFTIEARRFDLDTNNGLSVKERKYRVRCIKRLRARQLWTSIKKDKRVAVIVYETNTRLLNPTLDNKTSQDDVTHMMAHMCLPEKYHEDSGPESFADPEKGKNDSGSSHRVAGQKDFVSDNGDACAHGDKEYKTDLEKMPDWCV
ncbi:hypothetical protein CSUB01_11091 [Colletotrichum sublineola]|uniref:Uncharacterized protein n=1 Tax=Colletotrichum sublineola TaxID=1173701 RepID=A0A066XX77_COLSU|nr:hypothetical protein CSUB01_11091 [Colletotrichum sublineola]